ncbi:hypothetical protein BJ546DRAFT_361951 [Cryomyces antarcticus]
MIETGQGGTSSCGLSFKDARRHTGCFLLLCQRKAARLHSTPRSRMCSLLDADIGILVSTTMLSSCSRMCFCAPNPALVVLIHFDSFGQSSTHMPCTCLLHFRRKPYPGQAFHLVWVSSSTKTSQSTCSPQSPPSLLSVQCRRASRCNPSDSALSFAYSSTMPAVLHWRLRNSPSAPCLDSAGCSAYVLNRPAVTQLLLGVRIRRRPCRRHN